MRAHLNVRQMVYKAIIHRESEDYEKKRLWDCTTCTTCNIRCPKGVKPADLIIGMRGAMVEEGRLQPSLRDALEATLKHGNPWGKPREKRSQWSEGMEIKDLSCGDKAELLFYVCCTAAFDPRVQGVTKALAKLLKSAKVDFAILGNEENCCGSEGKRAGEEGLFEILEEDNSELFKKYEVNQILTLSPHCYNTFKNEYREVGFEVQSHSQFVSKLIDDKKLVFAGSVEKVVTYHDPCFMGKQNKIYDEPRNILASIPKLKFIELDRVRERSLCCEGGGARMWTESEASGERLAETRVKEAVRTGAEILATSCPFCLLTLEDATKTTGNEEVIKVMDVVELAASAI
jgi:Fe-S oxidoreductase